MVKKDGRYITPVVGREGKEKDVAIPVSKRIFA